MNELELPSAVAGGVAGRDGPDGAGRDEDVTVVDSAVTRLADFIDADIGGRWVDVIGCGAVGRRFALLMAGMGVNLRLWDDDIVDIVNIAPQGWQPGSIGKQKVFVLAEECIAAGSGDIKAVCKRWESGLHGTPKDTPLDGLLIAVDSMKARRDVVGWVRQHVESTTAVECRMAALLGQAYLFRNSEDVGKWYQDHWYPDEECIREPCTGRSTGWTANVLASMAAGLMLARLSGRTVHQNVVSWTCQDWADWKKGGGRPYERPVVVAATPNPEGGSP